jgi:F-type H+-transporting ATPase subunit b
MNFDWPTFFLEVVNFFILLWILRRFLYRPVLEVIAARQQKIEVQLQDAANRRAEADAARSACEANLAAWDQEKILVRQTLEQEIAAERERQLRNVRQELAETKARHQAQEEHERQAWRRMTEQQAIDLGSRFVRKLLERVASPELEARLVTALLDDFSKLTKPEAEALKTALNDDGLEIVSAFPLVPAQRANLAGALSGLAGGPVNPVFREDPTLLAGLLIHTGSRVLAANLRDELRFFQKIDGHGVV